MEGENKERVIVLLGSPRRKGNSAILAQEIARGARAAGAKVETVFLAGLDISPCRGCERCLRQKGRCVIRDAMQDLYPKIMAAQAWVVASPVYWFTMSAQMKIFLDRCFALLAQGERPLAGKRVAIAMSYGAQDPFEAGCVNALRAFQDAFSYTGAKIVGMVYGSAYGAGDIRANEELLGKARRLGKELLCPS